MLQQQMAETNNHVAVIPGATSSPSNNSHCEGGGDSPSASLHSSTVHDHDQHETTNNSSQHSLHNDVSSDDPTDFSGLHDKSSSSLAPNISSNIEIHPQNEQLGGSSKHQFIKRPLNAYMIWTKMERKKILTSDPKLKMNEVSKAIQMGEKWKNMTDKDKKPYFDLARKYSQEHKQALQDHPELQYAPSKKKGPKAVVNAQKMDGLGNQQSVDSSVKSQTVTPVASPRSNTPRQLIAQNVQSNQMFVPFQTPLNTQLAQVLGVRQGIQQGQYQGMHAMHAPTTSVSGGNLLGQHSLQQAFLQPQNINRTTAVGTTQAQQSAVRTTPSQMLDNYYNSLCAPVFPTITESPVNPLGMFPPQYLLDQYSQHIQQQQQQQQQNAGGGQGAGNAQQQQQQHF